MPGWLYRYEAKSIQDYVLGTTRLREIAGASALVESLSAKARAWARRLEGAAEPIATAAGGATLVFRSEEALRAFASTWPLACARGCPGLRVIQAWAHFEGAEPTTATMDALQRGLVASRAAPWVDLPEITPASMRAGRTGEAATEDRAPDPARRNDGGYFGKGSRAKDDLADDLALDQRFDPGAQAGTFSRSLERFGEGYLAVIHADGNGVGALIQREVAPAGIERWKAFSTELSAATEAAAKRAYKRLQDGMRRSEEVPFRPVVLGGDDLTVITRAEDAISFVADFLSAFEEETRARKALHGGQMLTACAGVALVKRGFPFNAAARLAERLCEAAKHHTKRHPKGRGSSFAFHRVTTASVRDWVDIAKDELADGSLVGGPWYLGAHPDRSFLGLCSLVRHFGERDVPRGAIREWLTLAQCDRPAADAAWSRMMEVLQGTSHGPRLARQVRQTFASLGADEKGWRADGTSPVGDALAWLAVSPIAHLTGRTGRAS